MLQKRYEHKSEELTHLHYFGETSNENYDARNIMFAQLLTLTITRTATDGRPSPRGGGLPLPLGVPLRERLHGRLVLGQLQSRPAILPLLTLQLSLRPSLKENQLAPLYLCRHFRFVF